MLLNDEEIRVAELAGQISFGVSFSYRQIQSSSVDLTAGKIYVPDRIKEINKVQDFSDLAICQCSIGAGETIIIELAEDIQLSKDIGGILLPPNSLAKSGIIMTNPGHIDPGYCGKLTVCLINMGRSAVTIESNSVVATLLLFKLGSSSAGYQKGPGVGASLKQLSKLSKDFANISERSFDLIKRAIWRHLVTALTVISLAIAVLAIFVPAVLPVLTGLLDSKYNESKNAQAIERLEEQIKSLQSQLGKAPPNLDEITVMPASAPSPVVHNTVAK